MKGKEKRRHKLENNIGNRNFVHSFPRTIFIFVLLVINNLEIFCFFREEKLT